MPLTSTKKASTAVSLMVATILLATLTYPGHFNTVLRLHAVGGHGNPPRSTTSSCLSDDPNAPVPVILMTRGRSGSSSIWRVTSNLLIDDPGKRKPRKFGLSLEYPSRNPENYTKFFDSHKTGDWLLEILCSRQQQPPLEGISGIKWKPFSVQPPGVTAAFKVIRDNPEIKLIRSKRNLLDVMISNYKHRANEELSAHCFIDDSDCQKEHIEKSKGLILPTEDLLKRLNKLTSLEEEVDQVLQVMGVPHIDVTYERLYLTDTADEWKRILEFLGRPAPDLSMADVRATMDLLATNAPFHNETLGNYEKVRSRLIGTNFENLLH